MTTHICHVEGSVPEDFPTSDIVSKCSPDPLSSIVVTTVTSDMEKHCTQEDRKEGKESRKEGERKAEKERRQEDREDRIVV